MNTQLPSDTNRSADRPRRGRAWKTSVMAAPVLLALLTSACAVGPTAQTMAPADPVSASRTALTRTLVLSCRESADCATVGIGARSCGGPEQYLAYGVRDTPAPALRQATQDYARLRKKQLEERGEMSTCEVLPDPGAQCSSAGQCVVLRTQPRGLPGQQAR